jgi:hypothetical protein
MKHLKQFNESWFSKKKTNKDKHKLVRKWEVLPDNMVSDLKDILLELRDEGYNVNVENIKQGGEYTIVETPDILTIIRICKDVLSQSPYLPQKLNYDDISETIERIRDYCNDLGYDIFIDKIFSSLDEEKLLVVYIQFTKK